VPIQQSVKITNKLILQQQSMIIKLLPPTESSTSRNKNCFQGTFALDSPPREGTCQDGKKLDAYQEQEAHQDAFITIPMSNGAQNSGTLCCFLTLTEFSTATSNFQAKNNLVTGPSSVLSPLQQIQSYIKMRN